MNMICATPSNNRPVPMPYWKRTIDITCCLVALPVFALFGLVVAIVLKIVSPGPV